ncbi:MAG: hypothetical protein WBD47_16580 [Phormidesmis sp.]
MFIAFIQGVPASTDSVAHSGATRPLPLASSSAGGSASYPPNGPTNSNHETVRHLLFGTPYAVNATIHRLHTLHYAEPNDWSQPIATERPGEVMAVLTKRVRISS